MAHVLIGAGIGAATSLATGGDPVKGALLGGVTGGAFGGTEGGLLEGASSAVNASTPQLGGQVLTGATTGAIGGATAGGVAGATASPYAFGSNALDVAGSTMNPALIGSSAGGQIPMTGLDRAIDTITPAGGYDGPSILDKVAENTGFNDMSTMDKVGLGLMSAEAFTPQEQAQQMIERPAPISPGKPLDVDQTKTGMLNVNVPTGFLDDVRKRQLFYGQ
jgi:hypothetical protein